MLRETISDMGVLRAMKRTGNTTESSSVALVSPSTLMGAAQSKRSSSPPGKYTASMISAEITAAGT